MKILHVGRIIHEPQNGVINVVPLHLRHQLAYADVALLNIRPFRPDDANGVFPVYFYSVYQQLDMLPDGFSMPDLVVFHEIYWPEYLKIYKYFHGIGVPYIVVPHGSSSKIAQKRRRIKKMLGNIMFFNAFLNSAAAIHYLSDFDRDKTVFKNARTIVQGSGIPLHRLRKRNFSQSGLKLIYVGRLDVIVKGLDIILAVAIDHKETLRELGVKITIAGSNASNGASIIKKSISDNNIEDIISLESAIFEEDKVKKILEHDIFFQLSRTEAQSLSLMEAMDIGMPTFVTPGTSFYEKAQKFNMAIPVVTKEDVFRAIVEIVHDKSRLSEIGMNASKYIKEHYEWNKVGEETIARYKEALEEGV